MRPTSSRSIQSGRLNRQHSVIFLAAFAIAASYGCDDRSSSAGEQMPIPAAQPTESPGVEAGAADDPMQGWRVGLRADDHDERLATVRSMARTGDERAIPLLAEALDDVDFRVRRDAAAALAGHGSVAAVAVPALRPRLYDEQAIVRERAVVALTRIGTEAALEALREYARSVGDDWIDQALEALGALGDPRAIPEIVPYLDHDDAYIRRSAARALARMGPASAPHFRQRLDGEDVALRCLSARALGIVGEPRDAAALRTVASNDPSERVRACALGGLGRLGEDAAIDRLEQLLRSRDRAVAEAAAESLGLVGSQGAINRLVDALPQFHRADGSLPNPAAEVLVALGEAARPTLAVRLTTATGISKGLLAGVIAVTGDPNDIPALHQALETTDDPAVRALIEDAISSIRERRAPSPE